MKNPEHRAEFYLKANLGDGAISAYLTPGVGKYVFRHMISDAVAVRKGVKRGDLIGFYQASAYNLEGAILAYKTIMSQPEKYPEISSVDIIHVPSPR